MPAVYGQVTLRWTRNGEADLAGYRIYYGTSPSVLIALNSSQLTNGDVGLTATPLTPSFTVTDFRLYGTLYFAVTAYDTSNNESDPSSPSVSIAVAPKLMPMVWG
jgi:hypothetical protein